MTELISDIVDRAQWRQRRIQEASFCEEDDKGNSLLSVGKIH